MSFWMCPSSLFRSHPNTCMLLTKDTSVLFCPQILNSLLSCFNLSQLNLAQLPSRKSWLMPQKKISKHFRPSNSHRCQKTQLKLALVEIHTRQQQILKIFKVSDGKQAVDHLHCSTWDPVQDPHGWQTAWGFHAKCKLHSKFLGVCLSEFKTKRKMAIAKSSSCLLWDLFETGLISHEQTLRQIQSTKPNTEDPGKNNPGQQNPNLAINAIIANTHLSSRLTWTSWSYLESQASHTWQYLLNNPDTYCWFWF